MANIVLDKPSEKQRLFLMDHHRNVGYGGSRGGGKSWSVRTKSILLCLNYPGIRCCIIRRTFPELETNHINTLVPFVTGAGIATYNEAKKRLTYSNGSVTEFRCAQYEKDLDAFQGQEWDIIFIDEATQWTETEIKKITACNRGVNSFPKRVYYTCNPGGPGHQYIKRIFIDKKFEDNEDPNDFSFIQSKVTDNKALMEKDPDYVKHLEALPPKLRKAWLDGDWDTMSGMFFEEFRDDPQHYEDGKYSHVIEPFDIPRDWKIYRSYDFGYAKPFSIAWWAVDYDGRLYRILEWYGCTGEPNEGLKLDAEQQFSHIQEIENQHPWLRGKKIGGVADPAIWNKSNGPSVADTAAKHQIYFEPGDNARILGWMQVHYRLHFDENGIPMMYIFKNCKDFIRTIPLQMYDEHNVEDIDTDLEDHIADETRYMCMMRPIKPTYKKPIIPRGEDPLNQRVPKRKSIFIRHG